ncbi:alpha-galactosidase [Paenibacillus sinopodophylli]|uniref:alpha-galactosidase n=1 Tax=Paenibacillus sinopodophylli TaxID=1837342 RepID=UPI00110D1885|nr:alpha-galactosidase [Paenibacillus sinopodophylli]
MGIGAFKIERGQDEFIVANEVIQAKANLASGELTLRWSSGEALSGLYAEARYGLAQLRSTYYSSHLVHEAEIQPIEDGFGKGLRWCFEHTELGKPTLRQHFRMYEQLPYLLTELSAESETEWETNELTPLAAYLNDGSVAEFGDSSEPVEEIRTLFIPFDNDKWVRFASHAIPCSVQSYETTAIYRSQSRNGFVIGSVTHDTWKTGIVVEGTFAEAVGRLRVFGGAADMQTRDTVAHGSLRGKSIVSPTIFVGAFADYRDGLEQYGKANAVLTPALPWEGGIPMGWNSWSAVMSKLDYDVYTHTSDFFAKELQQSGFADDNDSLYVNFDAFWNSLPEEQLKDAVRRVKGNGQKPGIYYTPFAFWGSDPDTPVEGTEGKVLYREILTKDSAGQPLPKLDGAFPIDPTHPEAQERIKRSLDSFVELGFDYVKLDFLTHGAMEGCFYNAGVRTGIQAYNIGMALVRDTLAPERVGRPFFINLSIAPLFPHSYAHSRRVSCDAFGMISDTEYMLNALTYGWWINDSLYRFNDPDHVVLYKSDNQRSTTEHEGRSRLNSAVIAGTSLLLGDDYREPEAARRAKEWMTNREVMALARLGETFKPVEGRSGTQGENLFMLHAEHGTYAAAFNFDGDAGSTIVASFARLGIDSSKGIVVRDLWSGQEVHLEAGSGEHGIELEPAESKLLLFKQA